MCLSNISDTAPDVPTTTGFAVTFFSLLNFLISSLRSWHFSIFSSSWSFTRASPGMAMSLILAYITCLSTKTISGLCASTNLSLCTWKSHRTLKLSSSATCSGVFVPSVRSSSAFPLSCQCIYSVMLSWHLLYSCCTNLLHSLVRWFTIFCCLFFILPYILAVWLLGLIYCYHLSGLSIHALKFFF